MGQLKLHRSYQAPLCDQFGFNQPLQQEPNGLNLHRTDWESGGASLVSTNIKAVDSHLPKISSTVYGGK